MVWPRIKCEKLARNFFDIGSREFSLQYKSILVSSIKRKIRPHFYYDNIPCINRLYICHTAFEYCNNLGAAIATDVLAIATDGSI